MRKPRLVLLACLVPALLALAASPAGAHAAYKSSEPASDATVASAPSRVTAEFTEPLAEGSYLRVTGPCGDRVDAGDVEIVGYEMSVSMSGAHAGRYVVSFRAFSRLDPHVTQGEFSFTATDGEACAGAAPAPAPGGEDEPGPDRPGTAGGDTVTSAASGGGPTQTDESAGASETGSSGRSASFRPGRPFKLEPDRAVVPNLQVAAARKDEASGVWDGIPIASFVTGLLLAAVIGAAGGKIYAGIMGPRA